MHEKDQEEKNATLKGAYRDSINLAKSWNGAVNKVFGNFIDDTPAFDKFAIRFNAVALTPFLWAGKKLGLMSGVQEASNNTHAAADSGGAPRPGEPNMPS